MNESPVYQQPRYYDLAFSFVNIPEQVDLFEAFIAAYSRIGVRSVLDLCCGPSRQLSEFARRGYRATGLDLSEEMLSYLAARAEREGVPVETFQADIVDFDLEGRVDFAFILMGSTEFITDNDAMLQHLATMGRALNPGGLYLLENLAINWSDPRFGKAETWEMKEGGLTVRTTFQMELVDPLEQLAQVTLEMQVNDHGERLHLANCDAVKLFMPQEFKSLVQLQGNFEFVGYFERSSTRPLKDISRDNLVVLRRR
ncbi:MAG: class I SAM-dependent methyltransferase [Armatimonadia bacterium]